MEPTTRSIEITPIIYLVNFHYKFGSFSFSMNFFQILTLFHSVSGYALYSEVEAEKFLNLAAAAYADSSTS